MSAQIIHLDEVSKTLFHITPHGNMQKICRLDDEVFEIYQIPCDSAGILGYGTGKKRAE